MTLTAQSKKSFRPMTRRDAVIEFLRNGIMTGEIAPGTELHDTELAGMLGVSITPVREAVALLEKEGLIVNLPNRKRCVYEMKHNEGVEITDALSVLFPALLQRCHLTDHFYERIRVLCTDAAESRIYRKTAVFQAYWDSE